MKIRLSETDYLELKRRPIQHGVLTSHWDPNQLSQEIGISIKKEYVKTQVQILSESDNLTLIQRMLDDDHFSFTYNGNEIKKDKDNFPKPGWTVYNFGHNKIVTVEA